MEIINPTTQDLEYPINSPEWHFQQILKSLGEDVNRDGLRDTPKRYIKFLREFLTPKEFKCTTFQSEAYQNMIIVRDIEFHSLCEHHIAPFYGTFDVGYIPSNKIVGISKIARAVQYFSSRLQNQERITTQIASFLKDEIHANGVIVRGSAKHMCMCMRGVKSPHATTITSAFLGDFLNPNLRSEFYELTQWHYQRN